MKNTLIEKLVSKKMEAFADLNCAQGCNRPRCNRPRCNRPRCNRPRCNRPRCAQPRCAW